MFIFFIENMLRMENITTSKIPKIVVIRRNCFWNLVFVRKLRMAFDVRILYLRSWKPVLRLKVKCICQHNLGIAYFPILLYELYIFYTEFIYVPH